MSIVIKMTKAFSNMNLLQYAKEVKWHRKI